LIESVTVDFRQLGFQILTTSLVAGLLYLATGNRQLGPGKKEPNQHLRATEQGKSGGE